MATALTRHLSEHIRFTKPHGGMFIWATLTSNESTLELFRAAVAEGVAFVPGEAFYVNGESDNSMRLNFSNSSAAMIDEGISRLADLINAGGHRVAASAAIAY
jgi:2-aminoadipate transaminase